MFSRRFREASRHTHPMTYAASSVLAPAPVVTPRPTGGARNGAEMLLDTLIECGIDTIFGYPGGAALIAGSLKGLLWMLSISFFVIGIVL